MAGPVLIFGVAMAKILVIEDDMELCDNIRTWLELERHVVEFAHKGKLGAELLQAFTYDAVVLDWELPEMTGIEILRELRNRGRVTPVLMLTGKGTITDKESGFLSGADDYLTKPFSMKEMCLRVNSLLRRGQILSDGMLKVRDLTLDPKKFRVKKDGKEIRLLPKEFALLEFLMRHPDEIYSAEALLERIWVSESDASPEAVRTTLRRLRLKIEKEGEEPLITTVHGVGYRLNE